MSNNNRVREGVLVSNAEPDRQLCSTLTAGRATAETCARADEVCEFPVNTLQEKDDSDGGDDAQCAADHNNSQAEFKMRAQTYAGRPFRAPANEQAGRYESAGRAANVDESSFAQRYGSPTRATADMNLGLRIITGRSEQNDNSFYSRQRATTTQATPLSARSERYRGAGYVSPDPYMPVEACTERIERLLQKVQDTRRETEAQNAFTSPKTPTRFDVGAGSQNPAQQQTLRQRQQQQQQPQKQVRPDTSSTVSTLSLSIGSDCEGLGLRIQNDLVIREEASGMYSPRRRAATVGAGPDDKSSALMEQRRRLHSGVEARGLRPGASNSNIAELHMKKERLRARRAARLAEQAAADEAEAAGDGVLSPQLLWTTPGKAALGRPGLSSLSGSMCSGIPADDIFFENSGLRAMLQELPMSLKDIEWDKRVHYYHVAQTDQVFREATETANIADCREECLQYLLGERGVARLLSHQASSAPTAAEKAKPGSAGGVASGVVGPSRAEVDAMADWIDDDSDVFSDEGDHSFDWSRDGFGYMEFRRASRASMASGNVYSPNAAQQHEQRAPGSRCSVVCGGGSANNTFAEHGRTSALSAAHDESQGASMSMLGTAADSGSAWSLSPVTACAAADNFNDAISLAGGAMPQGGGRDPSGAQPANFGQLLSDRRSSLGLRPGPPSATSQHPQQQAALSSDFQQALPRIQESGDMDVSDDKWQMLAFEDTASASVIKGDRAMARVQLARLRAENAEIREEMEHAQRALSALQNIYLRC
ncbi:hypothetical protein BX661DRAFT_214453 [Kickxella alabastrina]|uniref:uncharacterized protein n=1 Tax=Kickxella alabastrina TaxID=61397 RepID=UPI00221E81BF|nr:uncharacterized protein BX661DRAFT_214453 [Kickxella alabastrina]KAI7825466.1 hypothetical protein BX661DRAFT_214453 [Kickxella alabastrina]